MANVTETATYDAGVYQLEITDPLEGGPGGVLNKAIKNLANRTKWLKDFLSTKPFVYYLWRDTYNIGNVTFADNIRTITFPNVGTDEYQVVGVLISKASNYSDDNDVTFRVRNRTATSFKLCLRESLVDAQNQNLDFQYFLANFTS